MIQRGGDEQEEEAEERQGWGAGLFKGRREGYSSTAVPSQRRTSSLRSFLMNSFLLLPTNDLLSLLLL